MSDKKMTTMKYLQGVPILNLIHVLKIALWCMIATVGILFIIFIFAYQGDLQVLQARVEEVFNQDPSKTDLKLFRQFWRGQLPNASEIQSLSTIEVHHMYHNYLDNIEFLCRRTLRMGSLGDGGWEICDDYEFRPEKPCVVYSFGIGNDFSFDDDIGMIYGCKVYSFDPSMNTKSYNRSSQVTFLDMGLGGVTHSLPANWVIKTLSDIRAMLGHADVAPDIVKIDIEGSEWPSLNHSLHHGGLQGVRQLMVEFHNNFAGVDYDRFMLTVLSGLQAAGFRRFLSHKNPAAPRYKDTLIPSWYRPCCYEVYFVNTNVSRHGLGSVSPL